MSKMLNKFCLTERVFNARIAIQRHPATELLAGLQTPAHRLERRESVPVMQITPNHCEIQHMNRRNSMNDMLMPPAIEQRFDNLDMNFDPIDELHFPLYEEIDDENINAEMNYMEIQQANRRDSVDDMRLQPAIETQFGNMDMKIDSDVEMKSTLHEEIDGENVSGELNVGAQQACACESVNLARNLVPELIHYSELVFPPVNADGDNNLSNAMNIDEVLVQPSVSCEDVNVNHSAQDVVPKHETIEVNYLKL